MSPTIVAGGMKVALITTVGGLIVALILQVIYNYLLSKMEGILNKMEDASIIFLDQVINITLNTKLVIIMAVTKIHRTSNLTLMISVAISIVVMALFYLGGEASGDDKVAADLSQPKYTDIVLYWAYILLAITVVVLIGFAISAFLKQFKENSKKALSGFLVLLAMVALFVITFVIGDGTLLNIPGYDGPDNNPQTLKMTDMWLYSIYVMVILNFLAIIYCHY